MSNSAIVATLPIFKFSPYLVNRIIENARLCKNIYVFQVSALKNLGMVGRHYRFILSKYCIIMESAFITAYAKLETEA